MSDIDRISLQERALGLSQKFADTQQAYHTLLELEQEQNARIEREDIEGVAALIDQKQSILEKIQAASEELHREHEAWQLVRDQAPDALRERLQSQLESLQAIISRILELQQVNEEKLKQYVPELNSKLQELQKRRNAHRGYQNQAAKDAYSRSRFYDKNS